MMRMLFHETKNTFLQQVVCSLSTASSLVWLLLIKPKRKIGISERVPLIPPALKKFRKYKDFWKLNSDKKLLPIPTNQKVNAYLKELADICGIQTQITFHIARHTFASPVMLDNGVPIDSVSKMLGHRSIKTTQIYAKISDKKISDDTEKLFSKFKAG